MIPWWWGSLAALMWGPMFWLGSKYGYAKCFETQCRPLIDAIHRWKLKRRAEGFDEPTPQKATEPYSPDSPRKPDSHQA